MAWDWSYSDDATAYAEEQLAKFSRETLLEIAEEWKARINELAETKHNEDEWMAEEGEEIPPFVVPCTLDFAEIIEDSEGKIQVFTDSMLASWIWEQASSCEHGRTCSNGGHELYVCPHGCHTVDLGDMPDDWSPEEY
jgi:hypothetical protein